MLSQEKLLKLIDVDLHVCRSVIPTSTDLMGRAQQLIELSVLMRHLMDAKGAGNDQALLEGIVSALENSKVGYQPWREGSTVDAK